MLASSRSVSSEMTNVPPVVMSSSRSVASKNVSDPVPVQVLEGHENWVSCVRFCPDEDKLVTGSFDNTLRIWNRTTGAVVLRGHSDWVRDVDVSRDGRMIVSGSHDKTFRIWNRESGETMHVCEGHENLVRSVQFSPDSSRVVSGSDDETVRVLLVETGELAFEPIKCHGDVWCVRYSPSGDRIASGASSVQIWDAETGSGIVSIRNSSVISVAWTADGTHVIGGRKGEVTIWNSHTGEQLRTWKAHDNKWITLSLSPSGSHLATCCLWGDETAFVFDIPTGEQIAALKHDETVQGIAYSPSGKFIATGCNDNKVCLWEAPVVEDPPARSSASSFSSFLDRPAVLLAGPSRSNERELDTFWDTPPNRNQQAPPQREPQRVFDKVRNTYTNIFTRRPAGATQAISQSPVRETVEPVEVAAGQDKVFWVVVLIPTYNAVESFLYTLIHCRKPEDPDEEVPAATGTDTSQTAADNAAASTQSGHPETGDGPDNAPTLAGNLVIRSQPQRTASMRLSGETPGGEPHSSESPRLSSHIRNQPESIELIAIRETSTVSPRALPQYTPSADPLSLVAFREPSSSTAVVTSAPLSVSVPLTSGRPSPHNVNVTSVETLSSEEMAVVQELRRRKATSACVTMTAGPLSGPGYDPPKTSTYPQSSTSLYQPPNSATQPRSHIHVQSSQSSAGLDPVLLSSSLAKDDVTMPSPASPVADEQDLQHAILHFQEQLDQLRRRVNDPKRKATERDGLNTDPLAVEEGPSLRAEPLGPTSTASTSQAGTSTFSNVPSQRHHLTSAQSIADSIEAEERVKDEKRRAKDEKKKA
ncbi:WD40 repeat-like protein [Paxillus ammoniavirescens]|nr:WD40 repeat-like protein [Paxillus ammoniavirescens]